jgi:hypothetical protein
MGPSISSKKFLISQHPALKDTSRPVEDEGGKVVLGHATENIEV